MNSTLLEAYRRTAYIAKTPEGRLSLRVGRGCAKLDALLAAHDVSTWAYVTAFNPGSVRLRLQDNSERLDPRNFDATQIRTQIAPSKQRTYCHGVAGSSRLASG